MLNHRKHIRRQYISLRYLKKWRDGIFIQVMLSGTLIDGCEDGTIARRFITATIGCPKTDWELGLLRDEQRPICSKKRFELMNARLCSSQLLLRRAQLSLKRLGSGFDTCTM